MDHHDSQPASLALPNNIEGIAIHLSYVRRDMDTMIKKLDGLGSSFVTASDFAEHLKADEDHEKRIRALEEATSENPLVKRIVYGAVAIILTTVLGAIIYLVIKS